MHFYNQIVALLKMYISIFQKDITYCIDPNLCYDNPPKLPADFSVQHDFTVDSSNAVNASLNYTCRKECMIYFDNFQQHIIFKISYFQFGCLMFLLSTKIVFVDTLIVLRKSVMQLELRSYMTSIIQFMLLIPSL